MKYMEIHDDCPPVLARAIKKLVNQSGSRSTTARAHKYSIWSLCEKEIDTVVKKVLGVDLYKIMATDSFSKAAKEDSRLLENAIRKLSREYSDLDFGRVEIRQRFGALETLIYLIRFCRSFKPKTYSLRSGQEGKGEQIPRRKFRQGLEHFPFCELCEKLCESESEKVFNDVTEYRDKCGPSFRFCKNHRPGNSSYRRDHNYRELFHRKIRELGDALRDKTHTDGIELLKELYYPQDDFHPDASLGMYEQGVIIEYGKSLRSHSTNYPDLYFEFDAIIRYVARHTVYPKQARTRRKTTSSGKGGTLKRAKELLEQGFSISESAEKIGVSRQAVWKALQRAKSSKATA